MYRSQSRSPARPARPALSIVIALAAVLAAPELGAAPIEWLHQDLERALEQGAACDGHVLLDVYTTWCAPCQRLVRDVFPHAAVEHATRGMIAVKVDAEAEGGPEVVSRYHVVGYPTVLVLDARGHELGRVFGFEEPEEFARHVEAIRFGPASFEQWWQQFVRAGRVATLVQVAFDEGFAAAACGNYQRADSLLRGVAAADPHNERGLAAPALLVLGKYRYLRGAGEHDTAIGVFTELRTRFPETAEADQALIQAAIAHARAGRHDSALAAFEVYLAEDASDVGRINDVAFTMFKEGVHVERALALASAAVEAMPDDASLLDTLAELQFATGDREGARASIERAIALEPDNTYYPEQRARFTR